jgi:predicted aminopeptidase
MIVQKTGSTMGRVVAVLMAAAALVTMLAGCASGPAGAQAPGAASAWTDGPAYYWQAVRGHLAVWWQARPIEQVRADPATRPELRDRLALAQKIRRFASVELGLPDNGSYTRYAELGRPHVVWNVKATPELSLEPRRWCFPVAGCVAYRGFYDRADAEAFADRLRANGDDVLVSGVSAYSTLGWMDDAVLSTFIHYPEADLAGLIFHELAHQRFYLKGDTRLNESFATAVEIIGVRRWLTHQAGQAAEAGSGARALRAWEARRERREQFLEVLSRARGELERIYRSEATPEAKRIAKRAAITALRTDGQALRARWGQGYGYDRWFEQDIGNAHLLAVALYTDWVPAFLKMAERQGDDLPGFYREVADLAELSARQRVERLTRMTSPNLQARQ